MSQLDILNISPEEEDVYRLLLVSGQLSTGEIQFSLKKDYDAVKLILTGLVEKGLLRSVPGLEGRYTALLPVGTVKDELIASANKVSELSNSLTSKAENVITNLSTELEQKTEGFRSDLQGKKDQFTQSSVVIGASIETKSSEFLSANDSKISALTSTFNEMKETVNSTVDQHMKNTLEDTQASIINSTSEFKASVSSLVQKQNEIRESDITKLPAFDDSIIQNVSDGLASFVNEVSSSARSHLESTESKFSNTASEVTSSFNSNLDRIVQLKDEFEQEVNSTLDEINQHAKKVSEEQGNQLTGLFGQVQETLASDQETLKQGKWTVQDGLKGIDTLVQDATESILNSNKEHVTKFDQHMDSTVASVETKLLDFGSKVKEDTKSSVSTIKTSIQEKTSALQSTLEEMFNTFVNSAKERIQEISTQVESSLAEQQQTAEQGVDSLITENVTALKGSLGTLKTEGQEGLQAASDLLTQTVTSVNESNQNLLEKINADIDNQIIKSEDTVKNFEENIARINQELNDLYLKEEGVFNDMRVAQATRIKEVFTDVVASVREEVTSKMKDLLQESGEYKAMMEAKIAELQKTHQSNVNTSRDKYTQELNQLREDMQSKLTESVKTILERSNSVANQLGSIADGLDSSLKSKIAQVSDEIKLIFQTSLESFETSFAGYTDQIRTSGDSLISGLRNEFNAFLENSMTVVNSSYKSLSDLSNVGNKILVEATENAFTSYLSEFDESAGVVSNDAAALAGVLDSIYKIQQQTKTNETGTTHIIGTEANVQYISEIISRIKRGVTILVPNPNMVDDEAILNLPMTANVTIISYIDEFEHRDWIEKMHGASANITLRSISSSGNTLPDFIGCEREGEEILLAIRDEKAKAYVGIASLSEDFVKILGNIVIADYARGRSKPLKK